MFFRTLTNAANSVRTYTALRTAGDTTPPRALRRKLVLAAPVCNTAVISVRSEVAHQPHRLMNYSRSCIISEVAAVFLRQ